MKTLSRWEMVAEGRVRGKSRSTRADAAVARKLRKEQTDAEQLLW